MMRAYSVHDELATAIAYGGLVARGVLPPRGSPSSALFALFSHAAQSSARMHHIDYTGSAVLEAVAVMIGKDSFAEL